MESAIREVFKMEKGELEVPNDALYSAAAGAALHADGRLGSDGKCNLEKAGTDAKYREQMLFSCGELIEALRRAEERKQMQRSLLPRLVLAEGPCLDEPEVTGVIPNDGCELGIDIGSTSIDLVLTDRKGNIIDFQ